MKKKPNIISKIKNMLPAKKETTVKVKSIISEGTVVEGNIRTVDNIKIDGKVNGNIKSKGDVIIGKYGFADGYVRGRNVFIAGKCTGNATALDQLTLIGNASVGKDAKGKNIVIDEGATFGGTCTMEPDEPKEINHDVEFTQNTDNQ